MRFISTRDPAHRVSLSEALMRGLAPDGGLYIPEALPRVEPTCFDGLDTIADIAARLLRPFFEQDPLERDLEPILDEVFTFDVPLRQLDHDTAVLELFHGPTAAFKDIGARFLASSLSRLNSDTDAPLTILVATSGDTGGAVAAAFWRKPNVEVVVLYPHGRVSPRQEHQLTCWGENVWTWAVEGDFDACQRIVKQAFADPWWRQNVRLSSANSINIGRLLPQMTYYAAASLWSWREHGVSPSFIVPTGNLGNALACLWAREVGLPIGDVVLATNANRPIGEYLASGEWRAMETIATLANAMDVGNPSNMERLRALFDDIGEVRTKIDAVSVDDDTIVEQLRCAPQRWGRVWDPHTACAARARNDRDGHWILVATAHPAKFEQVVEPVLGQEVPVPDGLAALLERPSHVTTIPAKLDALRDAFVSRPT